MSTTTTLTTWTAQTVLDLATERDELIARSKEINQLFINNYSEISEFHNTEIDGKKITITKPSERLNVTQQPDIKALDAQKKIIRANIQAARLRTRPNKGDANLLRNVTITKVNPSVSIKK